jgi:DNA-directed RNA polymerase subunit RPC12/RpoP
MAISCSKCRRQYDVTLFQFGKTINCACGERVGLENRIILRSNVELCFFADVKIYWQGSHTGRMKKALENILNRETQ